MSSSLERFQTLKKQIAEKQREADKAQGALDEIMKQLKEEFGCSTIKDAQEMLKELRAQEDAARTKFELRLKKFEKKWSALLDG